MLTIYGLRLKGDREARYIGRTKFDPAQRLSGHLGNAKAMPRPTSMALWLVENESRIEVFEITRAASMVEARAKEAEAISFCLALNHRLFNMWLVPADRRLPQRDKLESVAA